MPDVSLILQSSILVLLLVVLGVLVRIGARIGRIEGRFSPPESPSREKEATVDVSYDGAFGKFVAEHPGLLGLRKSEQFAAYRKWRKEQGLNWEGK